MSERNQYLDVNFNCRCGNKKEKSWHLVCADCWNKLPFELREETWAAYKEEQGSERHKTAINKCCQFLNKEESPTVIQELRQSIAEKDGEIAKQRLYVLQWTIAAKDLAKQRDTLEIREQELIDAQAQITEWMNTARAEALASALTAERMREVINGFLTTGSWLGGSHPHFANYVAFKKEQWDAAKLVIATPPSPTLVQVREALEKCVGAIEAYMAPGDDIAGVIARVVRVKELTEPALTAARDALALMGGEKV